MTNTVCAWAWSRAEMCRHFPRETLRVATFLLTLTLTLVTSTGRADAAPRFEVGGFGRFARNSESSGLDDALGFGGRLGLLNSGGIGFEVDAAHSAPGGHYGVVEGNGPTTFSFSETDFSARFSLNRPLGGDTDFIFGIGYSLAHVSDSFVTHNSHGANMLVGLRHAIRSKLALRADLEFEQFEGSFSRSSTLSDSNRIAVSLGLSFLSAAR